MNEKDMKKNNEQAEFNMEEYHRRYPMFKQTVITILASTVLYCILYIYAELAYESETIVAIALLGIFIAILRLMFNIKSGNADGLSTAAQITKDYEADKKDIYATKARKTMLLTVLLGLPALIHAFIFVL